MEKGLERGDLEHAHTRRPRYKAAGSRVPGAVVEHTVQPVPICKRQRQRPRVRPQKEIILFQINELLHMFHIPSHPYSKEEIKRVAVAENDGHDILQIARNATVSTAATKMHRDFGDRPGSVRAVIIIVHVPFSIGCYWLLVPHDPPSKCTAGLQRHPRICRDEEILRIAGKWLHDFEIRGAYTHS